MTRASATATLWGVGLTPPGRLFHAVVLAGAAMGAGSCRRATLADNPTRDAAGQLSDGSATDGGGAPDLRIDLGSRSDVPTFDVSFDIVFGPGTDAAPTDAGSDEPRDASCDAGCDAGFALNPANCSCIAVVVIA